MKKILVLLSMFALASGAWAADGYPYTWTIDINSLPESYNYTSTFPNDLTAYLIDTSKPDAQGSYKVIAYVSTQDFHWLTATSDAGNKIEGVSIKPEALLARHSLPAATDHFYMNNDMQISGLSMTIGTDPRDASKKEDHFSVSYSSSISLIGYYDARDRGNTDPVLKTVLFSEKDRLYQVLDVVWAGQSTLQASAAFNPVPEPTSGLLLLLGVAGLILKRKKAA